MNLRTCEKCGAGADVASCSWCTTGQRSVAFSAGAESTVVLGLDDGSEQTVQFTIPTQAAGPVPPVVTVPRQRAALPETATLTTSSYPENAASSLPPLGESPTSLPKQFYPDLMSVPRLPTPLSAEQLAVQRLRPADDEESDSHLGGMLAVFLLALALAVGAGYFLATSLSADIQAFFDSVITAK